MSGNLVQAMKQVFNQSGLVSASDGTQAKGKPDKISPDLVQLNLAYQVDAVVQSFGAASQTQLTPTPLLQSQVNNATIMEYSGDQVVVEVAATSLDTVDALIADLEALGLEQGESWGVMISGILPIAAIDDLASLDSLQFARPVYTPVTSVGSVTSQATASMNTDLVLAQYGVDGSGVTVGVLSDSYNKLGGAAADVASGDLPGTDNPLGYTDPVQVLQDNPLSGNTDEGRAMLQLVHDVAPGADLAFHTAFLGETNFANGIIDLANAGADVIVDDVIYFTEPMFQDGMVAQAVDQVVADGVAYFSAAGNDGRMAYESAFTASGKNAFGGELHDFDPGPGVDTLQSITVPTGQSFSLSFQWDQPFFSLGSATGSTSDLDVFLVDITSSGPKLVASGATNNVGGDPVEVLSFTNDGSYSDDEFFLAISLYDGTAPDLVKYVMFADSGVTINEYDTASGTLYGHPNAAGAEAVGAAYYQDTPAFGTNPPVVEYYSSAGTTPILFDTAGNRLATPDLRQKPEIVAPDGANTTFFYPGQDPEGDGFPNFFGTSAAAPHAAAVAALLIDASPTPLSPEDIYTALETTAIDMDDPATDGFDTGFDTGTGYGLIQADQAVRSLLDQSLTVESNNTLTTAAISPVNGSNPGTALLVGSIGDDPASQLASDVDLMVIDLVAGNQLQIDLDANQFGASLDAALRLFDASGTLIASNDDSAAPGEPLSLDPYLEFTAPTTGQYYLGISSFDNKTYDPISGSSQDGTSFGDYSLNLTVTATLLPPEPNDTLTTATATGYSSGTGNSWTEAHSIGDNPDLATGLDVDLYAVTLTAGATLDIDIDTDLNGTLDSVLSVFDHTGTRLALNDDAPAPGETYTLDSYLSFTAATTGTYYIGVSGFNNSNYDPTQAGSGSIGSTGDYTLTLTAV